MVVLRFVSKNIVVVSGNSNSNMPFFYKKIRYCNRTLKIFKVIVIVIYELLPISSFVSWLHNPCVQTYLSHLKLYYRFPDTSYICCRLPSHWTWHAPTHWDESSPCTIWCPALVSLPPRSGLSSGCRCLLASDSAWWLCAGLFRLP